MLGEKFSKQRFTSAKDARQAAKYREIVLRVIKSDEFNLSIDEILPHDA